jgi:hypothetical protein
MIKREIAFLMDVLPDNSAKTIFREVKKIFLYHFANNALRPVTDCFEKIGKLFAGKFRGYRACNTEYHNLDHTLATFLATARLLDGYMIGGGAMSGPLAVNLLVATLFHDTGYIQKSTDSQGTGAKYTSSHVERSVEFLAAHSGEFRIPENDARIITRLIQCTGLNADMAEIAFASKEEKAAGAMLGTSDLLGQMADRAYLEKLLFLYYEFREAGIPGYNTEYDILRKTVDFYELTKEKFTRTFMGVFNYDRPHFRERYGVDRNLYVEAIDRAIAYLHGIFADSSTNFRHKLKRGNWREKMQKVHPRPKRTASN